MNWLRRRPEAGERRWSGCGLETAPKTDLRVERQRTERERVSALEDTGPTGQLRTLRGVLMQFYSDSGGIFQPGLPGFVSAESGFADGDSLFPQVINKRLHARNFKSEVIDIANSFGRSLENLNEGAGTGLEVVSEALSGALEVKALFHPEAFAIEASGGVKILGMKAKMCELLDHPKTFYPGIDSGKGIGQDCRFMEKELVEKGL